jgi:hypothetical protein
VLYQLSYVGTAWKASFEYSPALPESQIVRLRPGTCSSNPDRQSGDLVEDQRVKLVVSAARALQIVGVRPTESGQGDRAKGKRDHRVQVCRWLRRLCL